MSNILVEGFGTYGTGGVASGTPVGQAVLAGTWADIAPSTSNAVLGSAPWAPDNKDIWASVAHVPSGGSRAYWGRRVLPAAIPVAYFSMHVACAALPTSNDSVRAIEFRDDSNAAIGTLFIQSTGAVKFDYVNGSISSSGPVVVAEKDHHFEAKLDVTNKAFQLYIDGTKVLDGTALNFSVVNDAAQFVIIDCNDQQSSVAYVSHIIVRDTNGSYNNTFPIGDRRVATLVVASDDANNQGWTAQPLLKFGVGILDLTGAGAAVYAEATTNTDIGINDFTFEGQFRFQHLPTAATKATLFGKWDEANNKRSYELYVGGPDLENGYLVYRTSTDGTDATVQERGKWQWQPEVGHWYHIAMVRSSNKLLLFIDGVLQGVAIDDDDTYYAGIARAAIGAEMSGTNAAVNTSFDGWVDEFRLTIGNARYTANFTPPVAAFPRNSGDANWGSVKWLSSFDNAVVADDGPLTLALSVLDNAAAITPNDGTHNYEVLNKTTPDDDTFLEAALIAASGELTMTALPTAGETVTVGTKDGTTAAVYTWRSALAAAYDVLIGANIAACAANLIAAINGGAGDGTVYGTSTVANANVSAQTNPANQVIVTALTPGASGNAIATTETCAAAAWGGTTLSGGQDIPGKSQFGLSRMPAGTVTVDSVTLVGRQWKTDSGTGSTKLSFVGSGGGVAAGVAKPLGTTPNLTFDTIEQDPDTAAGLTASSVLLGKMRIERGT